MGKKNSAEVRLAQIRAILLNPFATYPGLSDRERSVLALAAKGKTSRQIADELSLSEKAVGTILYRLKPRIKKTKPEIVQYLIEQIEWIVGE